MNREKSDDLFYSKEKNSKVFWSSSLVPSSPLRINDKNSYSCFIESRKRSEKQYSVNRSSCKLFENTVKDTVNNLSVSVKRLKIKEYSLPIARNSLLYTTTKTKEFKMGLKNTGGGFIVHKYFIPRRVQLPNPKQIFIKHSNIKKTDQSGDISSLVSKKVFRKSKFSQIKNRLRRNNFD